MGEYDKALATIATQTLLTDLREDVERLRHEANRKLVTGYLGSLETKH